MVRTARPPAPPTPPLPAYPDCTWDAVQMSPSSHQTQTLRAGVSACSQVSAQMGGTCSKKKRRESETSHGGGSLRKEGGEMRGNRQRKHELILRAHYDVRTQQPPPPSAPRPRPTSFP